MLVSCSRQRPDDQMVRPLSIPGVIPTQEAAPTLPPLQTALNLAAKSVYTMATSSPIFGVNTKRANKSAMGIFITECLSLGMLFYQNGG